MRILSQGLQEAGVVFRKFREAVERIKVRACPAVGSHHGAAASNEPSGSRRPRWAVPNYQEEFPIPPSLRPERLRKLLEPVDTNPQRRIEITSFYENDAYGPNWEYCHMQMVLVPMRQLDFLTGKNWTTGGVVSSSKPSVGEQGGLEEYSPSVHGLDYIVASWTGGYDYGFNLSEKVWMALGLTPRCIGNDEQRIEFDDLSLPAYGVARGRLYTEYSYELKRNVRWVMLNEYLRRYLWMRGSYGARSFFYKRVLRDCPELRALMDGKEHEVIHPTNGWYRMDIQEFKGGLLVEVWGNVVAVAPELCPEQSAEGLIWPGINCPVTSEWAHENGGREHVYLDDKFLERYEQDSRFATVPVQRDEVWYCAPSYGGHWSFSDFMRVGRNMIEVSIRELYKPKPNREILRAHEFVLDPETMSDSDLTGEHIVSKVNRLVKELLDLGDQLSALGCLLGVYALATELVGFDRAELQANQWTKYPKIVRLARVAPMSMTESAFLSRCKSIHELWQQIPNSKLRNIIEKSGHRRTNFKDFGSMKLLQALLNIVERLNAEGETAEAFANDPVPEDLSRSNADLAPLFVNYDLRNADSHDTGDSLEIVERIGVDRASLNEGYGPALDAVFNGVIGAFSHLNAELAKLLGA